MSEVITTGVGDRYHATENCRALQAGRLGGEAQGYRLHETRRFPSAAEAEAAGRTPCGICVGRDLAAGGSQKKADAILRGEDDELQPDPADLARMLEGIEERRAAPAGPDSVEEIHAWLAARLSRPDRRPVDGREQAPPLPRERGAFCCSGPAKQL
ncbi:hypothetical protein [Streptosporangium sp. NPDC051022]|uniref:hypothetical protein n=1 Tax=Streptosporangium sp. NPDC051022 TaxID=3155752 RepID=UPI00344996AA